MERSDKYQVSFDGNSGSIAVEHPDGLSSMVDDTSINFKRVRIPYTMKLLIQEMEALGLKAQICFEDNKCDTENEYYEDAYFEVDPNTLSQEDDVADE